MDRFDELSQRPVRLKIDVPGFDLERSVRQYRQKLDQLKQSRKSGEANTSQAVGLTSDLHHQTLGEPQNTVEPVTFGSGTEPAQPADKPAPLFQMDL